MPCVCFYDFFSAFEVLMCWECICAAKILEIISSHCARTSMCIIIAGASSFIELLCLGIFHAVFTKCNIIFLKIILFLFCFGLIFSLCSSIILFTNLISFKYKINLDLDTGLCLPVAQWVLEILHEQLLILLFLLENMFWYIQGQSLLFV